MRLFFGLSLPDEIRAQTHALSQAAQACIPGRYAPECNHHLTLAFLGDVPPERAAQATAVLESCIKNHPAPRLALDGLDHFGRAENGILIIRVKSDPPLDALHERLLAALEEAQLPADRGPFSPHITLARHACIRHALPKCPELAFSAAQAHVFLSARDEHNILRYTPISTCLFADTEELCRIFPD